MTVQELLDILQKCNPEAIVVMSSDGEGNSYSPLSGFNDEDYVYVADSTWSGWLCNQKEQLEEDCDEEDECNEEDYCQEGVACLVLWPVN